ncbi:urea active transporter 1 like protein [Verticillium longisporum]|nr:urea active transporter 1 like protein [Verticillium longisporum]
MLRRAFKISVTATVIMTLAMLILWPMPMYGSGYIFSKPFFTGWVVVGIMWIFCSFCAVGLYPIFEGRATLIHTVKSMLGGKKPTRHVITDGQGDNEGVSGTATPDDHEKKRIEGQEKALSAL